MNTNWSSHDAHSVSNSIHIIIMSILNYYKNKIEVEVDQIPIVMNKEVNLHSY